MYRSLRTGVAQGCGKKAKLSHSSIVVSALVRRPRYLRLRLGGVRDALRQHLALKKWDTVRA